MSTPATKPTMTPEDVVKHLVLIYRELQTLCNSELPDWHNDEIYYNVLDMRRTLSNALDVIPEQYALPEDVNI
jgi:hypothetical protein